MTKTLLKTTTALVATLSLALPGIAPAFAQETVIPGLVCADGAIPPCPEGETPMPAEDPAASGTGAEADSQTEVQADPAAAEGAAPAADAQATQEPAAEPQDGAEPAQMAEPAAVEAAPVAEPVQAQETPTEEAVAPENNAAATEETETPTEVAPAADPVQADGSAAATADGNATEQTEAAPADTVVPDQPMASEPPLETAEPLVIEPQAEPAQAEPAQTEQTQAEPAQAEPVQTEAVQAEPVQAEEAQPEQPIAEEASAAAAAPEESATAEVTTQVITEENSRSSDQDFQTSADGSAAVAATPKKKDRMSDFEKALLVGAGALVVGAILKNGDKVVSNTGDRVVVQRGDTLSVLKDDDALLRRPGSDVRTETFNDGSTRTTIIREDGSSVVTIRDAQSRVLRRTRLTKDGDEFVIFDDTITAEPLPAKRPARVAQPVLDNSDLSSLRAALELEQDSIYDRRYSLRQIRDTRWVRDMAPSIEVNAVTFDTGSAAIQPSQAKALTDLGNEMRAAIADNPYEVFLIEGHTDAVGSASSNLALSDRRAESVALALTEYFDVPPENMVVQGYGESALKVETTEAARENRRATVRRITPLLRQVARN